MGRAGVEGCVGRLIVVDEMGSFGVGLLVDDDDVAFCLSFLFVSFRTPLFSLSHCVLCTFC